MGIETHGLTNSETKSAERQLALEIRSRKFGFTLLEGKELLDWGVRSFPSGKLGGDAAIKGLSLLLKLYAPSVVIARRTRRVKNESSKQASSILRKIQIELTRRSVRFEVLERRDIMQFYAEHGCRTKQEIAALLAENFRYLKLRVPRRRKAWEPERYILAIFDAFATAVAFSRTQLSSLP